jgi:hypothetical protein
MFADNLSHCSPVGGREGISKVESQETCRRFHNFSELSGERRWVSGMTHILFSAKKLIVFTG